MTRPCYWCLSIGILVLFFTSATWGAAGTAFKITAIDPNPFFPTDGQTVTITYYVPTSAYVTVQIMNADTDTVVRLLSRARYFRTGYQSVSWDGRDQLGQRVPDGIYTVTVSGTTPNGSTVTPAVGEITLGTPAPPQAFFFVSILPTFFDPGIGEGTSITYTVPCTANYHVVIRNGIGTLIRELDLYQGRPAGTYSPYWDGRTITGHLAPTGIYSITVEGTTASGGAITSCTEYVQLLSTTYSPPEYGQTIEGAGSANFNWLKDATTRFSIAFRAPRTGSIETIITQWRMIGDYGGGNRGAFTFELQTNGPDNFPSGIIVAEAVDIRPVVDGYLVVPLFADLTEGEIYHLVARNSDPDPSTNWSSPNTLMTRVRPWTGTGFDCAVYREAQWKPWTSIWNMYNTSGCNYVNGSHAPLCLCWTDGTYWGDPYWSSAIQSAPAMLYRKNRAGQFIFWDRPDAVIRQIGIPVIRVGQPGNLLYCLERENGDVLATGILATSSMVSTKVPTWVYVKLPGSITLSHGECYRLWFHSPSSFHAKNCYILYPPYGREELPLWLECGWGGTRSCYIRDTGTGWIGIATHDLTFSLQ